MNQNDTVFPKLAQPEKGDSKGNTTTNNGTSRRKFLAQVGAEEPWESVRGRSETKWFRDFRWTGCCGHPRGRRPLCAEQRLVSEMVDSPAASPRVRRRDCPPDFERLRRHTRRPRERQRSQLAGGAK